MIMPFEYYLQEGKAVRQVQDIQKAAALMKKAIRRINHVKRQKFDAENAEFLLEDIYEAMREAGQALMALKGYKPLSHEAVIAFIRDNFKINLEKINKFDKYRKIRNKLVYEAGRVSIEDVEEALDFAATFIQELNKLFKKIES